MTHEATQTAPETQPIAGYAAIEASVALMNQEAESLMQAMDTVYEASSDEAKKGIDRLYEMYDAAEQEAHQQGKMSPKLTPFLEAVPGLPEEFTSTALRVEDYNSKINAAEDELEKYAPEKAADIIKKITTLETSLDYDKVVAAGFADEDEVTPPNSGIRIASTQILTEVSRAIGTRKLLETNPQYSYQYLQSIETGLSRDTDGFMKAGLMKADPAETEVSTEPVFTTEHLADIETSLGSAAEVRAKYKISDYELNNKAGRVLNLIDRLKEDKPGTDIEELYRGGALVYNDAYRVALGRHLVQKLSELPGKDFITDQASESYVKLVEEAKSIDPAEALEGIEITGSFEGLPFEYSEAELKAFLLSTVPAVALASVGRIEFRPMTPEEDDQDITAGLHIPSKQPGDSKIIIADTQVKQRYQYMLKYMEDDENAETVARITAKDTMLRTITHEFGHAMHHVLPVAALKAWEEQRLTDPTNITAYVKDHHDKDHHHRYKEDFADTMALFVNEPEALTVVSPTRYEAMQQIYTAYVPSYPTLLKRLLELKIDMHKRARAKEGTSDEEFKKAHLWHETELI